MLSEVEEQESYPLFKNFMRNPLENVTYRVFLSVTTNLEWKSVPTEKSENVL